MPRGILIFGANGSGKSTLGRELAKELRYKHMDIEEYYFKQSEIPYTEARSQEDCLHLMLADIEKYGSFVLSAVTGDFGEEISSMYDLAVLLSAPAEVRIERIKQRTNEQYGERVHEGGDMYRQNLDFIDFVTRRSLSSIERWGETLTCPVLRIDGTKSISENTRQIAEQYLSILAGPLCSQKHK